MGTRYKPHYCDKCCDECEITSAMDSAIQQSLYVMENTAKIRVSLTRLDTVPARGLQQITWR